jgi:anti-anti-sigma regulatory factor
VPEQLRSESLQLTVSHQDGGPSVVSVRGELDVATAGYLKQTLKDAMQADAGPGRGDGGHGLDDFGGDEAPDARFAVVDLTEVSFMDSTGLGALIAAREHAARLGRSWRLCGVRPDVQRVLSLSGAELVFSIYPDLDSAVRGPDAGV